MKPPKDPFFYFRYVGLGLLVAAVFSNSSYARYLMGIGLLLLAVSFMKKRNKK